MASSARTVATLVADVVGSRAHADRRRLHRRLIRVLTDSGERHPWIHAPRVLAGDEFEATYDTVGAAIAAAAAIRLELLPDIDLRCGIGFGEVTMLDDEDNKDTAQDGPGWWSARSAIEHVEARAARAATGSARMAYRTDDDTAPPVAAVDPALSCLDALVGRLDERSLRLLRGLLDGRSQRDLAAAEEVSTSAISQRVRAGSLVVITDALTRLATL